MTHDERTAVHAFCLACVAEPRLRPSIARWMIGDNATPDDHVVAAFIFTGDPHLRSVEAGLQTDHHELK